MAKLIQQGSVLTKDQYRRLLSNCAETVLSDSPLKISYMAYRPGTFRPSYEEYRQIVAYEGQFDTNYLNEHILPETPVRLIIDIDRNKATCSDPAEVRKQENAIYELIIDALRKSVDVDVEEVRTDPIYNLKSGNCRVYTDVVLLGKYRAHFTDLLTSMASSALLRVVKFDGNPQMRPLWSYKVREQTDEEKAEWVDEKYAKYKVVDRDAGCYWLNKAGRRSKMILDHSTFVEPGTAICNIKAEFALSWNQPKKSVDRVSSTETMERIGEMKHIDDELLQDIVKWEDPDKDGLTWRQQIMALYNIGGKCEDAHRFSERSQNQYDDKAKEDIEKYEDIEARWSFAGLPFLKKHLLPETPSDIIRKIENTINQYQSLFNHRKPEVEEEKDEEDNEPVEPGSDIEEEKDDIDNLQIYPIMKQQFERTAFKCLEQCLFYITRETGVIRYSEKDLQVAYRHLKYKDIKRMVVKPFIKQWINDPYIRRYIRAELIPPPLECPKNTYNLWNGFAIDKVKLGSFSPDKLTQVQLIYDHLFLLCNKETESFEYVKRWIAFTLQKPGIKPEVMLLFKSLPGLGKEEGTYKLIRNIIGKKYTYITKRVDRDIFGSFNGRVENKLLLVLDEMDIKTACKYEEDTKELITREDITINRKGVCQYDVPSYFHTMSFSNGQWPYKIDDADRRFFAIDASSQSVPDKAYFRRLSEAIKDKIVLRLFYEEMLEIDLREWDASENRPVTQFMRDLKSVSRSLEVQFIIDFLSRKNQDFDIASNDLYNEFFTFCAENRVDYRTTHLKFGLSMKNMRIDGIIKEHRRDGNWFVFNLKQVGSWLKKKGYVEQDLPRLLG